MIFSVFSKQYRSDPEIIFSEFMAAVERGDVREVVIQGHHIQGKYKNGDQFRTFEPDDPELVKSLRDKNVKIAAKPDDESPWYMNGVGIVRALNKSTCERQPRRGHKQGSHRPSV